jgi:hypothetical protein
MTVIVGTVLHISFLIYESKNKREIAVVVVGPVDGVDKRAGVVSRVA